jgi:peroxiredoxin
VEVVDARAVDQKTTPLPALVAGHPALINLWATWCESCERELTALDRLDHEARAKGGLVLGVSVGEAPDVVREFARKRGLGYALYVDESFALADALGSRKVPTTIVVDRAGAVVFSGGALDERALDAFNRVLSAAP